MPARRQYSAEEEAVYRLLSGYLHRKRILGALEKEHSALRRRLMELAENPVKQACAFAALPGGYSWSARSRESLERELAQLIAEQETYDELLGALSPLERQIVRLRHEEGKSWCALGQRVYLCERQAQRIYREAIRKMGALGQKRNLFVT